MCVTDIESIYDLPYNVEPHIGHTVQPRLYIIHADHHAYTRTCK